MQRLGGTGSHEATRDNGSRFESEALVCLADLDVDGCRQALLRLAHRVTEDALRAGGDPGASAPLLLDVLHRVNRRLHAGRAHDPAYRASRLELIRRFSDCRDPADARRRFRREVGRLLAAVESTPPPLVAKARVYIREHYHRRISLSSIAEALNVSPSHLSRSFRRATAMTVTSYVHRVRLEHARMLLAVGSRSISEIAYRVGYQTYRDFYRNFVRHERLAPRDARRRLTRGGAAPDPPLR